MGQHQIERAATAVGKGPVPFETVLAAERSALSKTEGETTLGIALSGGGVRSAAFGLGVFQALMALRILHRADYLSTVSGGGYIGAALTWFRKRHAGCGDQFFDATQPFGKKDSDPSTRSDFVSFVRQHGNYLFPGNGLNPISTIAVCLRSLIVSAMVYFAFILSALSLLILISQLPFCDDLFHGVVMGADRLFGFFMPNHLPFAIKGVWQAHSLFRLGLVGVVVFLTGAILIAVVLYATHIALRLIHGTDIGRYSLRVAFQKIEGAVTLLLILAAALSTIPMVQITVADYIRVLGVVGYLTGVWAGLAKMRTFLGKTNLFKKVWIGNLLFRASAIVFVYSVLIVAYHVSLEVVKIPATIAMATNGGYPATALLLLFVATLLVGLLININDSTMGSLYRDRLMETFLPDDEAVKANQWGKALSADQALLETMCQDEAGHLRKPYHLINTNVILSRAQKKRYKDRKGDSFLLSPRYCGSTATGYVPTARFMKNSSPACAGITLATAMSTSGAAVNPHAGVAGAGPTCDRFVSFIMTFFNLRLGFWATNPFHGAPRRTPNFLIPGLCSLISCFGHHETSRYIELSDGGHFENLGLYELIRRRVDTIIVSDGSADKHFAFGDLANAIERVRADFGAYIRFRPEQETLGRLLPASFKNGAFAEKFQPAEGSVACGTIEYPLTPRHAAKTGRIFLIKSTLLTDLPADLYGYRARFADFPDQTTSDQFFDERQFDAYRELGYRATLPLGDRLGS